MTLFGKVCSDIGFRKWVGTICFLLLVTGPFIMFCLCIMELIFFLKKGLLVVLQLSLQVTPNDHFCVTYPK